MLLSPDRPCRRRLDVRIRHLIHRRQLLHPTTTTTMAATLPERPFRMRRRNDRLRTTSAPLDVSPTIFFPSRRKRKRYDGGGV